MKQVYASSARAVDPAKTPSQAAKLRVQLSHALQTDILKNFFLFVTPRNTPMISTHSAALYSNYTESALFALLTHTGVSPMLNAFRFPSFGEVLVHGDVGDPRIRFFNADVTNI